jgi:hypothetical protein
VAGPVNIEIGVWDQPTGGTPLYGETHSGVALVDGVFNLLLGTGSGGVGSFDADLFAAQNRYLEVTVDTEVRTPRQAFRSVAYALQSGESDARRMRRPPVMRTRWTGATSRCWTKRPTSPTRGIRTG